MRGAVRSPQEAVDDRGRFEAGADEEEDRDNVADLVVELRVRSGSERQTARMQPRIAGWRLEAPGSRSWQREQRTRRLTKAPPRRLRTNISSPSPSRGSMVALMTVRTWIGSCFGGSTLQKFRKSCSPTYLLTASLINSTSNSSPCQLTRASRSFQSGEACSGYKPAALYAAPKSKRVARRACAGEVEKKYL